MATLNQNPHWAALRLFQSSGIVQSHYQKIHGRVLDAGKAQDIKYSISQAGNYFFAASKSDMIVKPLLIYYGCLGLARSLIMYLQGVGESHLKSSHGLRELDWRHKFSGDIKSFLSLEMKVTDGTSLELQTATANKEYMEIPILKYELAHHSRPFSINRGDLISVDTILSRLNTISVEYHEVTKQQRNSLALMGLDAFNNRHNGSGVDWSIRVDNNELQKPEYDWARALLSSLPERAYAPGVLSYQVSTSKFELDAFPPVYSGWPPGWSNPVFFLVREISSMGFPSHLSMMFLLSYALGMLARYFPSKWTGLLSGSQND